VSSGHGSPDRREQLGSLEGLFYISGGTPSAATSEALRFLPPIERKPNKHRFREYRHLSPQTVGRLLAIGAALVLGVIVTVVHFLPTAHQESSIVIYGSWAGLPAMGAVAVAITFAIVAALLLMAANAIRVGRATRRW
jgi:hypothetical protein